MGLKDEDKKLKTEDFDDQYKIHYYAKEYDQSGKDDVCSIVVFEKLENYDDTSVIIYNGGVGGVADDKNYRSQAREIKKDDELTDEEKEAVDALKVKGKKFEGFDLSFRESLTHDEVVQNLKRFVNFLGSRCPKYVVTQSWDKIHLLAPDSEGKKIKSCTTANHLINQDEALAKVGAPEGLTKYLMGTSMGSRNCMALLYHDYKNELKTYERAFLNDPMVSLGDWGSSIIFEVIAKLGDVGTALTRWMMQANLHTHEWAEMTPLGINAKQMLSWCPVLISSNTEGMFKFYPVHNAILLVAHDMGVDNLYHVISPTPHSYMPSKYVSDWLIPAESVPGPDDGDPLQTRSQKIQNN